MSKLAIAPTSSKAKVMQLLKELRTFMEPEYIISDQETLKAYECDGVTLYKQMPLAAVLPASTEQVEKIVKACFRLSIPIVARGAGTGLSGGATPHAEGIVLSLARLNKIIDIDPLARIARLQPGVRNLAISEQAKKFGLYYSPDPSSQIACTIGGNVAENSGGVHCLKYGLTVNNVLKVSMITAEGEQITLGSDGLDSCGADLLALINGAEGMLGIVTEITVKLLPIPEQAKVILAAFDSIQAAGDAVGKIIGEGIIPAGLEMMDSLAIEAVEAFTGVGYPLDAQAVLLCEVDGLENEVQVHAQRVEALFKKFGATSVRASQSEEERQLIWKGRKTAFPALGRISPDYYCMDGTIPRRHLAHVLQQIQALSQHYNLRVANVFHAGDGNLHPLILFDESIPGEVEKVEEFGGKILELCVEVGGSITGEHGVGCEKLDQMKRQFNDIELNQFHAVKASFDAANLLNPGKAIPNLKRCQEYRAINTNSAASLNKAAD